MEELVGQWWHRVVTRMADRSHPEAAVHLEDVSAQLTVIFRSLGGLPQWRLASAAERSHGGPRTWMQRLAGGGKRSAQPVLDAETLALPPTVAVFDDAQLNRFLYVWLAGQGAARLLLSELAPDEQGGWLQANLYASAWVLHQFPGWVPRYQAMVRAVLALRPDVAELKGKQAQAEEVVQTALRHTLSWRSPVALDQVLPAGLADPVGASDTLPVCLWVTHEADAVTAAPSRRAAPIEGQAPPRDEAKSTDGVRRRARQTKDPHERSGLMMFFRTESLLSWAELVNVNRQTDDDPDDNAQQAANDMDTLSVAPGGETLASRVRFDLDLPSSAADDTVIDASIRVPEWDHRKGRLLPDHCGIQLLMPKLQDAPWQVPPPLRVTASRMRRRLESLRALPRWQSGYTSGERLEVDAWVRHMTEQAAQGDQAQQWGEPRVFARPQRSERSLATLLLADLSLSTDAWATQEARVIDVIRDALYVFGQAMDGLGDPFEMLGFSSVRRDNVRVHALKQFEEHWSPMTRDRIGAIKPGYYTRMGAALRYATRRLEARPERQRLLLLLTDGKPNDLDHYEGRFGLEDTRHAVHAARQAGLYPFCITIDEEAADYLPYLFGQQGYALVHRPQDLIGKLTQVVAMLSA